MDAMFFLNTAIRPMLRQMDGTGFGFSGTKAETLLLGISLQESGLSDRIQGAGDKGPARSFFQFERVGVLDVVQRRGPAIKAACAFLVMPDTVDAIWHHMAYHDPLSVAVARLTLHLDKHALPDAHDEEAAWQCYLRTWRPGKPHRDRWASNWPKAAEIAAT